MNKQQIKDIVEKNDSLEGKLFDLFVQFLIVVSLVSFSVETVPDLSASTYAILDAIEVICVLIFTAEYCLRVYVADSKPRFVFSFFGLIDLLAIVPFYLPISLDLRVVRAFRLLRIFKLFRYNNSIMVFKKAFTMIKDELILFGSATLIVIYLAAVGIYYFENEVQPEKFSSVIHSLWWGVTTLTTVGYGDAYPITMGGKIFTFVILMVGLGVVAVPSGLLASALTKAREECAKGDE